MPRKITEITPAQVARFGEWAAKWIAIGLSTEPADFERATAAALRGYKLANLNKPIVMLRMGSPYAATVGGALAWAMLREIFGDKKVAKKVRSQVWSQVGSQVYEGAANEYMGALWCSWTAYVSFLRDVMAWDDPVLERFTIDEDLAKSCGWVWWHENVLAISDRPEVIRRDENF